MVIFTTLILLLGITSLTWFINKTLSLRICPMCVSVSGTWLLLTAAVLFGYASKIDFLPIILILMGGTIVGVAYQAEKYLGLFARHPLFSKITIIAAGIPLAYWAARNLDLKTLILETAVLIILAYLFFFRRAGEKPPSENITKEESQRIKSIEEKLKNCC